ncbi:MAG: hypothetical protein LBJ35_07820 [Spirochaetaceae bacterium]|nr:hypothetical protein [Spirochaetaceae bacterium]
MKKIFCIILLLFFLAGLAFAEDRTLQELFPSVSEAVLQQARNGGYSHAIKTDRLASAALTIKPAGGISIDRGGIKSNTAYIIESLLMLKNDKPVTKLAVYNALCKIRTLQGMVYFSSTRGRRTALFEEASRVAGENNLKKQNDPPPAQAIPSSETIFIMVKDVNFGNCFYRAEIKAEGGGIRYTLANFKSINYLFIPVIKTGNLFIQLYIESLDEGVLIYGLTCVGAADFADKQVDIPSTIQKRLDVIYEWINSNIKTP